LHRIINSVADPIFVKDRQHHLLLVNDAYCSFVGYSAKDVVGKTDYGFFPKNQVEIFLQKDEAVLNTGVENINEEEITDASGKVHTVATKKALYVDDNGEKFIVGVMRDITERKRIEKLKDDFIGTVSHELRTPLSITKEGVSLILDKIPGPINDQQARILTVSKNNIDRLSRIINSLLDISRIESGKVALKIENIDLVIIIGQVISSFETKIKDKSLEVRAILPKTAAFVEADPDGIIQVLTNLMANSLKFTEKGSISISLEYTNDSAEISVSDTGVGISVENLPKLFEKFQQFGRVNGPGEKGTGLGLAIAKGIISAHKGLIWTESEVEKGTKITFTLPKKRR
jgi:PAS domain S-box-containing protein